jgi:hypothetical protein
MSTLKIVAIALIAGGILGLAYGGFTYTQETHEVNVGSLSLSVDDKRRVNIPVWAGVGMLIAGGLLYAGGSKRGSGGF